mmetsp:Transcript_35748/g.93182  ORF Transcript_35748/g.93182 Transcript_35748/m.93182 type:complete len:399 (-) Transcript_35748:195-1391(-)
MSGARTGVAVVGGGIIGLATAYRSALAGHKVVVFEKDAAAMGASIRNFGFVWPIGQAPSNLPLALRSREIWMDVLQKARIWSSPAGSFHVAHHPDEEQVLHEFISKYGKDGYDVELLSSKQAQSLSPHLSSHRCALHSKTEVVIDSPLTLPAISRMLREEMGVEFHYDTAVTSVDNGGRVHAKKGGETSMEVDADHVVVCCGQKIDGMHIPRMDEYGLKKVKLNMMKTGSRRDVTIGPGLCAGLTLLHYDTFLSCDGIHEVRKRMEKEQPDALREGVHLLVAQNSRGEIIIGDSHTYFDVTSHSGKGEVDPFIRTDVNDIILRNFHSLLSLPDFKLSTYWMGVYLKCTKKPSWHNPDHPISHICEREGNITYLNGFGGCGMTLSFGAAERALQEANIV